MTGVARTGHEKDTTSAPARDLVDSWEPLTDDAIARLTTLLGGAK